MSNYIVIHKVNNNRVSRWDFGEALIQACEFYEELSPLCYQKGEHHILIKEETCKEVYRQKFFTII